MISSKFMIIYFTIVSQQFVGSFTPCESKDGWLESEGYCFYFSELRDPRTWSEASHYCKSQGGDLVSITMEGVNEVIADSFTELLRGENAWIGLRAVGVGSGFHWEDGSPLNYNQWLDGEAPKPSSGQRTCVQINQDGKWTSEDCSKQQEFVCMIDTLKQNETTPDVQLIGHCLPGFNRFENKCYKMFGKEPLMTWTGAEKECLKLGQNVTLVSIHSTREQDYLTSLVGLNNVGIWIGLRTQKYIHHHYWIDQTEFDFDHWAPGEPNSNGVDECVEMFALPKRAGQWNDVNCSKKRGFVCQTRPDEANQEPPEPKRECDVNGYVRYRGACFSLEKSSLEGFDTSDIYCAKQGGHLASVKDKFENAFLTSLAQNYKGPIWIGLNVPIGSSRGEEVFSWKDGWPLYFTNWATDQPSRTTETERCVSMTTNRGWTLTDCSTKLPKICKISDESPPEIVKVRGQCPQSSDPNVNFVDVLGSSNCFHFEHETKLSQSEAAEQCASFGQNVTLASFQNKDELDLIERFVLGFNLWIGLQRNEIGGYEWSDESPASYFHWAKNEPSLKPEESCVELLAYDMTWNNVACDTRRGYICSAPKDTTEIYTSTEITMGPTEIYTSTEITMGPTGGMGGGTIALLAVSILVGLALSAGLAYYVIRRRRALPKESISFENQLFSAPTA